MWDEDEGNLTECLLLAKVLQKPETIIIDQIIGHSEFNRCYSQHATQSKSRIIGEGIGSKKTFLNRHDDRNCPIFQSRRDDMFIVC